MSTPTRARSAATTIPTLGIVATSPEFCAALEGVEPPATIRWSAETRAARADYLAWSEQAPANPGRVQLSEIMFAIRRRSPDGIFTNGAGNFSIWVGRFLRFRQVEQQLGPTSGSMGFGLPAAIGAQRVFPKRTVVCFAGDGDFLMNGQEFATAVQYGLPIVVVLIDNGMYGTIRMHQEREYPGPRHRHGAAQSRISPPTRARSAATARRSRRRPSSCPPSSGRWPPACRRSCTSRSIPTRSRRRRP